MQKLVPWFSNRWFAAAIVAVLSFISYIPTVARTVQFTDCGELAASAITLGIAHPTGYPLFTLLGRLVAMLPTGLAPILALNFFSAAITALSAGLFVPALGEFMEAFRQKKGGNSASDATTNFIAGCSALILAWSGTYWFQAVSFEVYALHLLLVMLVIYSFLLGLRQLKEEGRVSRMQLLFAFALGLSFANHMTTILLAPAFLYLFLTQPEGKTTKLRQLLLMAPFFLLGLSVYLYLPVRATSDPMFNWGDPSSISSFYDHVSGKQYRIWMFSGADVVKKQLAYFVNHLSSEFTAPVLGMMVVGLFASWRRSMKGALFLNLLFVTTLLYAVNYDIHEIDPYFLLCYISAAFFFAIGCLWIIQRLRTLRFGTTVGIILLIMTSGFQYVAVMKDADRSHDGVVESFVDASLSMVEQRPVIFSSLWDYFVSPVFYRQAISQMDSVIVVDHSLLKNRVWYVNHQRRRLNELASPCFPQFDAFLSELRKFESGIPFNPAIIQLRWDQLLDTLVATSLQSHPVYVDYRIEPEFPKRFVRTPSGLFVRLSLEPIPFTRTRFVNVELPQQFSDVTNDLRKYVGLAYMNQSLRSRQGSDSLAAEEFAKAAAAADPQLRSFPAGIGNNSQLISK